MAKKKKKKKVVYTPDHNYTSFLQIFPLKKQFTIVLQGSPYGKSFDKVMWRCVQAGLIGKWLKDLNLFYLKERLEKKSPAERRKDKEEAELRKDDGKVSQKL